MFSNEIVYRGFINYNTQINFSNIMQIVSKTYNNWHELFIETNESIRTTTCEKLLQYLNEKLNKCSLCDKYIYKLSSIDSLETGNKMKIKLILEYLYVRKYLSSRQDIYVIKFIHSNTRYIINYKFNFNIEYLNKLFVFIIDYIFDDFDFKLLTCSGLDKEKLEQLQKLEEYNNDLYNYILEKIEISNLKVEDILNKIEITDEELIFEEEIIT